MNVLIIDAVGNHSGHDLAPARALNVDMARSFAAWEAVQPVLHTWGREKPTDFPNYKAGSSGPSAADELLARNGRRWHSPNEEASSDKEDPHAASRV